MKKASLSVRAAIAIGLLIGTPYAEAQGRPACAERTLVVQRLADRYGETLQSMGLNQSNGVVEVYASEETGTWTILVTSPDGKTCLLAAGKMWEADATPLAKPGQDA